MNALVEKSASLGDVDRCCRYREPNIKPLTHSVEFSTLIFARDYLVLMKKICTEKARIPLHMILETRMRRIGMSKLLKMKIRSDFFETAPYCRPFRFFIIANVPIIPPSNSSLHTLELFNNVCILFLKKTLNRLPLLYVPF